MAVVNNVRQGVHLRADEEVEIGGDAPPRTEERRARAGVWGLGQELSRGGAEKRVGKGIHVFFIAEIAGLARGK